LIRVYEDVQSLDRAMAELFVAAARGAIAARNQFTVALGGGNTPRGAYRQLAREPYHGQVDWTKVHVFWGDERNVPSTDPNSNEGMAREAFLDEVPIPRAQIFGMYTGGKASEAAVVYEATLRRYFGERGPTFDLVHLGMGPDGHTASLFPGSASLAAEQWVVAAETTTAAVRERISLTPALICRSREVVFEVSGADKAETLRQVVQSKTHSDGAAEYPAAHIARCTSNLTWLLDSAAASLLEHP
jgi:6-phosphogluconolactonase